MVGFGGNLLKGRWWCVGGDLVEVVVGWDTAVGISKCDFRSR